MALVLIDPTTDPPGSRFLMRQGGDAVDEEKILEYSPDGVFIKMRPRVGLEFWQKKDLASGRAVVKLPTTPPVVT